MSEVLAQLEKKGGGAELTGINLVYDFQSGMGWKFPALEGHIYLVLGSASTSGKIQTLNSSQVEIIPTDYNTTSPAYQNAVTLVKSKINGDVTIGGGIGSMKVYELIFG